MLKLLLTVFCLTGENQVLRNHHLYPKKGGGVLLELSHEIDYMLWLF